MWTSFAARENHLQDPSGSQTELRSSYLANGPDHVVSQNTNLEDLRSSSVISSTSPVDRIATLEGQIHHLDSKRSDVSRFLADTVAHKPSAIDLKAYEEWEQRKKVSRTR